MHRCDDKIDAPFLSGISFSKFFDVIGVAVDVTALTGSRDLYGQSTVQRWHKIWESAIEEVVNL